MIDFTQIALAVIAAAGTILLGFGTALINGRVKDAQARSQLEAALDHSLGAIQQAASAGVTAANLQVAIPGITPQVSVGLQYVLDHAGAEAAQLGITPSLLAGKISARIGLANIQTNLAIAASPAASPPPLAPLPPQPQGTLPMAKAA